MKKNVTFQFIQVTILIFVAFGTVSEAGISLPTFYNSVKVAIKKNDLSKLEKKLSYAERDRYLVKNLSSPLKDGETLLTYAIKNSNYQISEAFISKKLLINVPNLIGETPLIIAINQKKYHLVNELLKVGVNVLQEERSDLLRFALCTNNFKVIDDLKFSPDEFNATDADGNNAMMFALINNCNPSFISRYLNLFKIDVNQVNQNQQSFFGLVLETKSKELIDASIKLGADINLPSKFATVEKEPILLPMMYGILDDDFNLIRKISQHDFFDIDAVDESTHKTYLNFAAELGRANIVDFLIYNQCDINKPDKNGNTPYINACKNGHLNIIEKLKISGADINFVNFLDKRDGLSYLIEKGEFERYLKMLDEFSQVSEDYLYYAVKGGAHDIAKHLIDSGVDPNKEGAFITEDHDMDGTDFPDLSEATNTPLFYAIEQGDIEMAKILLTSPHIDLTRSNHLGDTYLNWAVINGAYEVVEYLLKKDNIDIESPDNNGNTPLLNAIINGNVKLVKLLLRNHAQFRVKNKEGQSAFYLAKEFPEINNYLNYFRDKVTNGFKGIQKLITPPISSKDLIELFEEKFRVHHEVAGYFLTDHLYAIINDIDDYDVLITLKNLLSTHVKLSNVGKQYLKTKHNLLMVEFWEKVLNKDKIDTEMYGGENSENKKSICNQSKAEVENRIKKVRDILFSDPDFIFCPTKDCLGGKYIIDTNNFYYICSICDFEGCLLCSEKHEGTCKNLKNNSINLH